MEAELDLARDLVAARTAALVVPREGDGVFRVTGGDRLSWLNGLLTCDLAKAKVGDAVYGLLLTKTGRIQTDVTVLVRAEELLVVLPLQEREAVMSALDRYLVMEDALIEAVPEARVFAVHGPDSLAAAKLLGDAGACVASRDVTGLGGAIVLAMNADAADAWGDRVKLSEVWRLGGEAAWEALRLERAVPAFAVDFDSTTYPQEAGLEKSAVSFSKGCYLGQEVVCMLELRGHVKRKLAVLEVDALATVPPPGTSVLGPDGAPLGAVTSAALSPTAGKVLAFAMLKTAAFGASGLTVDGVPARVRAEQVK